MLGVIVNVIVLMITAGLDLYALGLLLIALLYVPTVKALPHFKIIIHLHLPHLQPPLIL